VRTRRRDEEGVIAVLVALSAVSLFVIAALIVDLGLARDTRRQSQNAADASALAAVNVLYGACSSGAPPCYADAVEAARTYAQENFAVTSAEWSSCTDDGHFYVPPVLHASPCISFTDSTDSMTPATPTKVRVVVPVRNVKTGFGVLAGVQDVPINSAARAELAPDTSVSCALCFMNGLDTKKFKVDTGTSGVYVDGALHLHPGGVPWTTGGLVVSTDVSPPVTGIPAPPTPQVIPDSPGSHDPWATRTDLPPSTSGLITKDAGVNPCSVFNPLQPAKSGGPGIYGAWEFGSNCTLVPGLYVLTEAWTSKNKTLTFNNVTLYATCGIRTAPAVCAGPTASGGSFDSKNASLTLTSPIVSLFGSVVGVGIVYDRDNHAPIHMQGNGSVTVAGAIYAPNASWDFNGTSDVIVNGGPVILGTMTGNGTTGIRITNAVAATVPGLLSSPALDQ